jgi:Family of unknown function (DUF6278)
MDSPSPANARQLADLAVNTTRNVAGIELDFSPASLERVDELISGFRDEGHTAETMNDTICLFGCYLGEVIIHNHGGQWKVAADTAYRDIAPGDLLVLEAPNGAVWNPLGKAFKLLENGMEDSLAFFYGVATSNLQT